MAPRPRTGWRKVNVEFSVHWTSIWGDVWKVSGDPQLRSGFYHSSGPGFIPNYHGPFYTLRGAMYACEQFHERRHSPDKMRA